MSFCFSEFQYRGGNSDFDEKDMEVQFRICPNVISFLIRLSLRLLEKQLLHYSYSSAFEYRYFSLINLHLQEIGSFPFAVKGAFLKLNQPIDLFFQLTGWLFLSQLPNAGVSCVTQLNQISVLGFVWFGLIFFLGF